MRKTIPLLFLLLAPQCLISQDTHSAMIRDEDTAGNNFNQHFTGTTLRIDFVMAGNSDETKVYLWRLREEPFWGGPRKNLLDPWNSGNFRYSLFDSVTGELCFRKGFSTLFEEYQGTPEAKSLSRAYMMTAVVPYPRKAVRFEVETREYASGSFKPLFKMYIDPLDYFIVHEPVDSLPVVQLNSSDDPSAQLDIVFLAEGYTPDGMSKFMDDARRISEYILSVPPFDEFAEKITFRAVESPSYGSGIDIPGKRKYVNTVFNSSFYTFDSERYLTTPDTWSLRDAAANVPYDHIIVLNNSEKYGGGGFYNHYCQSTVDNEMSVIVTVHEFGHAFGGLADEYTGGVSYDGFYNLQTEPWEPNITTNVDFGSKWLSMISDSIPVPTPRDSAFLNVTGMFEGGGYMNKGIYSPAMSCRMKDNSAVGFCPVCREALRQKIIYYCD